MREDQALWNAHRNLAARESGLSPRQPRVMQGQAQLAGQASAAMRLPALETGGSLYNEDGDFIYMMDYDPLDEAPLG